MTTIKTCVGHILTLVFVLVVTNVYAQPSRPAEAPSNLDPAVVTPEQLGSHDLSGLDSQWWEDLSEAVDEQLKGSAEEQEEAMRKVIFLASYYPDKARFNDSVTELYNIWRFNRDEKFRVMALAALFAMGDEDAMRLLAYRGGLPTYAGWDPSPLVRRLTAAAVARYYGEPRIEVGPLAPITGEQNTESRE